MRETQGWQIDVVDLRGVVKMSSVEGVWWGVMVSETTVLSSRPFDSSQGQLDARKVVVNFLTRNVARNCGRREAWEELAERSWRLPLFLAVSL